MLVHPQPGTAVPVRAPGQGANPIKALSKCSIRWGCVTTGSEGKKKSCFGLFFVLFFPKEVSICWAAGGDQ